MMNNVYLELNEAKQRQQKIEQQVQLERLVQEQLSAQPTSFLMTALLKGQRFFRAFLAF